MRSFTGLATSFKVFRSLIKVQFFSKVHSLKRRTKPPRSPCADGSPPRQFSRAREGHGAPSRRTVCRLLARRPGTSVSATSCISRELSPPSRVEFGCRRTSRRSCRRYYASTKWDLVELRYFAGLTIEDAAQVMSMSLGTAKRRWTAAKAWLRREISRAHG